MKAVVDASCLIGLSLIHQLDLLKDIFKEIYVPQAVLDEVVIKGRERPGAKEIASLAWLVPRKIQNVIAASLLQNYLGRGEAEVIVLAREVGADVVLLDEKEARQVAQDQGMQVMGTIALLKLGGKKGLIKDLKSLLNQLRQEGFRISDAIVERILEEEG